MGKNQFLVITRADMGYSHITPFTSFKEASRFLEDSKLEGEIFKGKTVAFSHKVESWKVEKVNKIKVKEPITLEQQDISDISVKVTNVDENPFNVIFRCFICGNKATTVIDQKPLCKDCGGV